MIRNVVAIQAGQLRIHGKAFPGQAFFQIDHIGSVDVPGTRSAREQLIGR